MTDDDLTIKGAIMGCPPNPWDFRGAMKLVPGSAAEDVRCVCCAGDPSRRPAIWELRIGEVNYDDDVSGDPTRTVQLRNQHFIKLTIQLCDACIATLGVQIANRTHNRRRRATDE